MGKQRNSLQIKEKEDFPEELNEMEANNLSDIEFRVMIVRIRNNMKKDMETIKNDKSEIKNAISEINNMLEGINSRQNEGEHLISIWKTREEKTPKHSSKKKKDF